MFPAYLNVTERCLLWSLIKTCGCVDRPRSVYRPLNPLAPSRGESGKSITALFLSIVHFNTLTNGCKTFPFANWIQVFQIYNLIDSLVLFKSTLCQFVFILIRQNSDRWLCLDNISHLRSFACFAKQNLLIAITQVFWYQ